MCVSVHKANLMLRNPSNIICCINIRYTYDLLDHINYFRETTWQDPTHTHEKTPSNLNRKDFSQDD